jgi:hypothetical protein
MGVVMVVVVATVVAVIGVLDFEVELAVAAAGAAVAVAIGVGVVDAGFDVKVGAPAVIVALAVAVTMGGTTVDACLGFEVLLRFRFTRGRSAPANTKSGRVFALTCRISSSMVVVLYGQFVKQALLKKRTAVLRSTLLCFLPSCV